MTAGRAGPAAGSLSMLFFCICGMAIGLAVDCGGMAPELLASLCVAGSDSLAGTIRMHLALLPATHLMMLAGALVGLAMTDFAGKPPRRPAPGAIAARVGVDAACIAAMFAGMMLGGRVGPAVAGWFGEAPDFTGLVGAMMAGMLLGTAVAMPLHRLGRSAPRRPAATLR